MKTTPSLHRLLNLFCAIAVLAGVIIILLSSSGGELMAMNTRAGRIALSDARHIDPSAINTKPEFGRWHGNA